MDEQEAGLRQRALSEKLSKLSPAKRALLEKRIQGVSTDTAQLHATSQIKPVQRTGELPLSLAQQTVLQYLWFTPGALHVSYAKCYRLTGPFSHEILKRSLEELARRHEILRTTFPLRDGKPTQVIARRMQPELPVIDLRDIPESERVEEAVRILGGELERPYDLATEPLWRARLVQLGERDFMLLLAMDHLIADDWAMNLLVRDGLILYQAFSQGFPSPLDDPPIQYADFAYWQSQRLQGKSLETLRDYWGKQLEGIKLWSEFRLPFERISFSPSSNVRAADHSLRLTDTLTDSLKDLGRRHGATLFMTILATLVALLHRYTGEEDIAIPSTTANRHRPETRELMGWLSDLLVFRFRLNGIGTFKELLQHVRAVVLEAGDYQDLPFGKFPGFNENWWVEATYPSIRFTMRAESEEMPRLSEQPDPSGSSELTIIPVEHPYFNTQNVIKPGMTFYVAEEGGSLNVRVTYEIERYESAEIALMLEDLRALAEMVVVSPDQLLAELPRSI